MVGVKKFICLRENLSELISQLMQQYNKITLFLYGSPEHTKHNLIKQQVLVHAWQYKPRPDKQN